MKKFLVISLLSYLIIFLYFASDIFAQSKILINEFLIDPQPQSVELFNSGTESADISDWIIDDSGGTTFFTIPKDSIIFPNQCLVFSADFNLNKSSADILKLINNSIILDSFSYKSSSGSGISYLRFPDGSIDWSTGSANLGFYNQTDISCLATPTPTPEPTLIPTIVTPTPIASPEPTAETGTTPTSTPIPINNIYLSEVMVNPPTGEKEWVEIYNDNDFAVSLNSWYIDDLENAGSTPKIFSLDIKEKSYAVFDLGSSIFNNDGDNIRLLDFNKITKDDFEYQKTKTGKTLGRVSLISDDFCLQEPSKNLANSPCINPTPTPTAILTIQLGQKNLTPTINIASIAPKFITRINPTTPILTSITNIQTQDILGVSTKNTKNNLVDLLSILSFSYSLLTIISILIRMKLLYGKDKRFYSPFIRSS